MLRSRPSVLSRSLLGVLVPAALVLAACKGSDASDDSSEDGGASAMGGSPATGGVSAAGGASAAGGVSPAGGAATTGGATGGGGASGSGGVSPAGGASATGGVSATGGAAQAGAGGSAAGGTAGSTGAAGGSAGAPASGGTSGAASGSGGSGGTGTTDPCATAIYCDDFESYTTTPKAPWGVRTTSGSVAIDTTTFVSGKQSVKLSTQAASSVTAMLRFQGADFFPSDGNVIYGRMLFKLDAAPTTSVHWTIIQGLGVVPGQTYHAAYRYGGQVPVSAGSELMANYETPDWYSDKNTPGSDCWHHATNRVLPVADWVCVEWKFDGPANGMQFWLNTAEVAEMAVMGHGDGCVNAANDFAWTAPSFTSVDVGWESYQTDLARTAWIDDVVISTTRVGCPAGFPPP